MGEMVYYEVTTAQQVLESKIVTTSTLHTTYKTSIRPYEAQARKNVFLQTSRLYQNPNDHQGQKHVLPTK